MNRTRSSRQLTTAVIETLDRRCMLSTLDTVIFGNGASETAHSFSSSFSQSFTGSLSQSARRLTPQSLVTVNGGSMTVTMAVDPVKRNYFTVKLWGGDDTDSGKGRLYLYVPDGGTDYQVGYRHEGDYAPLSVTASSPSLPGRFFYSTTLLPLSGPVGTQGKTSMTLKIQSTGELYGLGSGGPPDGNYQFNMDTNSRGIYRGYTHTQAKLDVSGETQGAAPTATTRPATSENSILGPSGTYTNGLNNWINGRLSAAITNFTTSQVELLAKSYSVSQLVNGYQNVNVINKVIAVIDGFTSDWYANPGNVSHNDNYGANGGNEVWGGRFGPLGWAIHQLSGVPAFDSQIDTMVDYGAGGNKTRRVAWGEMLQASRDHGRSTRDSRYLTNQSILADINIYKANRAMLDLGDADVFTETAAQRYLKESAGILPWLGSDLSNGNSSLKYGSNYYQVTDKGLTREWGYAGGYSEMAAHVADFYRWTNNTEFRDQAVKMVKAIANLRRPAIEVSGVNNYRSMERIGLLAWRGVREADGYFANDISYASGVGWSKGMIVAGVTLDPYAIGYAKQMLADNHYLNNLVANSVYYSNPTFDALSAMDVYEDYYAVKNAADSGIRLPMTDGQPDFAWADEENGIAAIKNGSEKLWIEPYWQAKTGTGINGIGRFHYSTPTYDQYGTFEANPQFDFSGSTFVRPNLTDYPERYLFTPPENPTQAYAGERLPVGNEDPSANDQSPFRGKVDFYGFRFGNYLFGMNRHDTRSYDLKTPNGFTSATDLVSNTSKSGVISVGADSTVILHLPDAYDAAPVPTAPLLLEAMGLASQISLDWRSSSGATGYDLKRSLTSHGFYTLIASNVPGTSFVDANVSPGATYYYIVTAVNGNGESYPSPETAASAGLPGPWNFTDLGGVNLAGTSTYLPDGTLRLAGSGSGVGGSSDSAHFAYVPVTGNATIIAQVFKMNTGGQSIAGVMMRESLDAASKIAAIHFEDGGNMRLLRRTTTGGAAGTSGSLNANYKAPGWIRLERIGSTFNAYYSPDGVSWGSPFSSQTISMNSTIYVGLDAASRTSVLNPAYDQLLVGNFKNVQVYPAQKVSAAYPYETSANKITFSFTADVSTSLSPGDLQLTKVGGGAAPGVQSVAWDAASRTATFALNGTPDEGDYVATLPAGSVTDALGNTINTPFSVEFFTLIGDANRDRLVDTQDFNILSANFGASGKRFSEGNFSYDPGGFVNSVDFNTLITHYGKKLPLSAPALSSNVAATASGSPFADMQLDVAQELELLA